MLTGGSIMAKLSVFIDVFTGDYSATDRLTSIEDPDNRFTVKLLIQAFQTRGLSKDIKWDVYHYQQNRFLHENDTLHKAGIGNHDRLVLIPHNLLPIDTLKTVVDMGLKSKDRDKPPNANLVSPESLSDIIELKPNIFGIGVNLNLFIKRIIKKFKK
jgi:hypothetical protein